ncbi:hypothetical protein [Sphingomonas sp.]|uniref:hypothetical protein n=1 Tax=Sphingomonas sp. TaxID=28214 RepID=UPI003AFF7A37
MAAAVGAMLTAPALAAPPVMPNAFNDRLARLSPTDRLGALRRAVTSGDKRCGRLDAGDYRGPWGNLRVWQVHCTPGGDYNVFVGPAGEIQVRSCAELKGLDFMQCAQRRPKR